MNSELESTHSISVQYNDNEPPNLSGSAIKNYLKTRPSTLFTIHKTSLAKFNPVPALRTLTSQQWSFYLLGWLAWSVDSMDFFCVSASASDIAVSLGVNVTQITWGITLVLMLRSVGAIIFGYASDRYGRKWPFIACCICFIVLEIGSGFVQTLSQFLAVRALFGIAMGGMYGNAALTLLENIEGELKSVLSGFFLPGYNFGYLLLIVFYRAFITTNGGEGWRSLFWFSSGLPVILIVWRLLMPESPNFVMAKQLKKSFNESLTLDQSHLKSTAWTDAKLELRTHWLILIYLIFLMSGFNFMSHGSQDLYPTMLTNQKGFSTDDRTIIMVVINIGAMCGGIFFGQLTEVCGRRLTIIICCVMAGALLYPSFFVDSRSGTILGTFWLQFAIMGCWGVAPLHLMELCPDTYRTFTSGLVYQLGNLASSLSSTIEATLGSRFPIEHTGASQLARFDYAKVMAIFMGCVLGYMILVTIAGPERFHKDLSIVKTAEKYDISNKLDSLDDVEQLKSETFHKE